MRSVATPSPLSSPHLVASSGLSVALDRFLMVGASVYLCANPYTPSSILQSLT